MANPFDQFDTAAAPTPGAAANPFDQFDAPGASDSEMHTYQTRGPNGKLVQFQGPANADDNTIRRLAIKATGSRAYAQSVVKRDGTPLPATDTSAARALALGAVKPLDTLAVQLDKIPGVEAVDRFLSPDGRSATEQHGDYADAVRNNTRTNVQTLGKIAGIAPLALIPGANTTAAGMMVSGAVGGGLLSDATDARGLAGDAGIGAVAGLVGGKVLAPLAGAAVRGVASGAKAASRTIASLAGRTNVAADPVAVAAAVPPAGATEAATVTSPRAQSILLKTLAAQPGGVEGSIDRVAAARSRGVPLALMDSGDEARGLASSLGRSPGDARTVIRGAVLPRQDAQIDRITGAVRRDLGDTANVRTQSEALMQQANAQASPLYDAFRAQPSRTSDELESLLATPAGRSAIGRARIIAANERVDPNKIGFTLDDQGETQIVRTPSPQTLDYVKRGLDDVVEDNRDKTTGRLVLNTGQRAENDVRGKFVAEMDRLYPDTYAAARKAYAGPAAMTSALRKGAAIGTKDAETLAAETRDLSPAELDQYRLGVRSALVKQLEARTDGSNKVQALVGSPKKRAALAQLFGGEEQFGRFMATLGDEGQAAATYGRVNTGSATAANVADDAQLGGLTGVAVNAGERALRGTGLVHNAVSTLADLYRYGAGEAGARVRAELARSVSNMDPAELESFKAAARELETTRLRDIGRTKALGRALAPASAAYAPRPAR